MFGEAALLLEELEDADEAALDAELEAAEVTDEANELTEDMTEDTEEALTDEAATAPFEIKLLFVVWALLDISCYDTMWGIGVVHCEKMMPANYEQRLHGVLDELFIPLIYQLLELSVSDAIQLYLA